MPRSADKVPIRALLIAVPSPGFASRGLVDLFADRLGHMFCRERSSITRVHETDACTGPKLRETIKTWLEDPTPDVPQLFYFHGHGGRARFEDLGEDLHYLQLTSDDANKPKHLLDVEISSWMTQLHASRGLNLSVIIDACYSGTLGRAEGTDEPSTAPPSHIQTYEIAPTWVRDAVLQAQGLAAVSHPGVVRLTGSSPVQPAYLATGQGVGRMTTNLLQVLEELGDEWRRTSWLMLAHALRQRVIEDALHERQWVSIAGPRERLLFSLQETAPTRSVGLVEARGHHWIRAGASSGVEIGDRWEVLSMLVDEKEGEPRFPTLGCAAVCMAPDPNRACIGPAVANTQLRPRAGTLARVRTPMPVFVSGPELDDLDLDRSTVWLRRGDSSARQHLRVDREHGELELIDTESVWCPARARNDAAGRKEILELLEDRARTTRLLESARREADRSSLVPIRFEFGSGSSVRPTELGVGDCVWIRVENHSPIPLPGLPFSTWFVAVVLIDAIGRPVLLNSSQPEGIEFGPGERAYIGQRIGAAAQGLILTWPTLAAESTNRRRLTLAFMFSRRPIELGHMTVPLRGSDPSVYLEQGLSPPAPRSGDSLSKIDGPKPPSRAQLEVSTGWGFARTHLWLRPTP